MRVVAALLALASVPLGVGAQRPQPPRLVLGDLILRNSEGAVFRMGRESISYSGKGDFQRSLPIDVAYQVVSSMELPEAITSITLIGNAGRDSLPAIRIRFPSPIPAGTGTIHHELHADRIPAGRYRLELTVVDSSTRQRVFRQSFLRLQ